MLVYPDVVFKSIDDLDAFGNSKQIWALDYGKLIPTLTKTIQEQQQIEELKYQIKTILALINL